MKYYFAYGMNTNVDEMQRRCPTASNVGRAILPDHKFVFKYHADIVQDQDSRVEGVLWVIGKDDENSLDMLEGYPVYYEKKQVTVWTDPETSVSAMTYYMTDVNGDLSKPASSYFDTVKDGYLQNKLNTQQLVDAVAESKIFV